jgi:hypothetical protein
MADVIFKDNVIQTGFRIKIPKSIVDTLNLKIREKVLIKFDPDKRIITIEEDKSEKAAKK